MIRVYDEAGYAIETHGHKGRVQRVVSFEIMMEREKREKATFAKAFPEIEQCIVEVQETGHGVSGWIQDDVRRYTNPGEYINCSNPVCYSGGIKLGRPIRDMVRARETETEGSKLCQGSERSTKGRRIYRKCTNFFKYKITIKYRTPETKIGD